MAKNTTEQDQVAAAPVVSDTAAQKKADAEMQAAIDALFAEQFGGEDGAPSDGVEAWDPMVREQVLAADTLQQEKEAIYTKMEANRTLLRAFSTMGKVPPIVADYYYKPRVRKNGSAE